MVKFREHRGSLVESMNTVVEIVDLDALLKHLHKLAEPWPTFPAITRETVELSLYARDERNGWYDTYIVVLKGYGVLGFTNGPLN